MPQSEWDIVELLVSNTLCGPTSPIDSLSFDDVNTGCMNITKFEDEIP